MSTINLYCVVWALTGHLGGHIRKRGAASEDPASDGEDGGRLSVPVVAAAAVDFPGGAMLA